LNAVYKPLFENDFDITSMVRQFAD